MKKGFFLSVLGVFILIACVVVGGYFYINLVYIPRTLLPQITSMLSDQLKMPVEVKKAFISTKGQITILDPAIYTDRQRSVLLAKCSSILVKPAYPLIYKSWKNNRDKIEVPLRIEIRDILASQSVLNVKGQIDSDILLKLNLKNFQDIEWNGNVAFKAFQLSGIPVIGEVRDIQGTVLVKMDEISSIGIRGKTNESPVLLSFSLKNFTAPQLELKAELTPLSLSASAYLKDQTLELKELQASYQKIKLIAKGRVDNLQTSPQADISVSLDLDLKDLCQLPLEIKTTLAQMSPSGIVTAKLQAQGDLSNPEKINASIKIRSDKISVSQYDIDNITVDAELQNGILLIKNTQASLLKNTINLDGKAEIIKPAIPYSITLTLKNAFLENIEKAFKLNQKISGTIDSAITAQGNAAEVGTVSLTSETSLKKLTYNGFPFPPQITISASADILGFKDINIKKLTYSDNVFSLEAGGLISNIYAPSLNLSGKLECKTENLKSYSILSLPANLVLNGKTDLTFKVKGNALNPENMEVPFDIQTAGLGINQFSIEQGSIKGIFKSLKTDISSLLLKLYGGEVSAKGHLDLKNSSAPDFSLNAYISDFNMGTFSQATGLLPQGYNGILSSEIMLSGSGITPDTLNAKTSINANIENGSIQGISLDKAHATVSASCANSDLTVQELQLIYKTIVLKAKGTLTSFIKNPTADFTMNSSLDLADIKTLPVTLPFNAAELNLAGKTDIQVQAKGPIKDWTSLNVTTRVNSDKISVKNVVFDNPELNAALSNKLLNASLSANSYNGTISANAESDFLDSEFKYKASLNIKEIDIEKLINESKIIPQKHKGILSLTADASGIGSSLDTITGKSNLHLINGYLSGIEILQLIGTFLNTPLLEDIDITQADGNFTLENSLLSTQDTQIAGPDVNIRVTGGAQITTQVFENLIINLALTQEGVKKTSNSALEDFFDRKDGIYQQDIRIKGTLTKPEIDKERLLKNLAKKQIQKGIEKIIEKESGIPSDNPQEQTGENTPNDQIQKGVEQILEKGLKGLFKK